MKRLYKTEESVIFAFFRLCTMIGVLLLVLVVLTLIYQGSSVINVQFLTASWNHTDITKGGVFPAILGSFYIGVGVMLCSFPVGFATALFLTEYTKENWFKRSVQLSIRNLAGIPSVIYGMFGLAVFVHLFSFGTSLLAAICTLSMMTLPWIITASVVAIESIPRSLREASLALGATKWQTIVKLIVPGALPTGITGGIIANARAMGETAPLIMVGATFYLSQLPQTPFDKFMALPYHTFILATQHSSPYALSYANATALTLITLTFALSLVAIGLRYYYRLQRE